MHNAAAPIAELSTTDLHAVLPSTLDAGLLGPAAEALSEKPQRARSERVRFGGYAKPRRSVAHDRTPNGLQVREISDLEGIREANETSKPDASTQDSSMQSINQAGGQTRSPSVQAQAQVHFEQQGTQLTAIEIGRESRFPVVSALHRTLFALGIVVASYHVRTRPTGLVERVELQRRDGGAIEGSLSAAIKEAVLPIALNASDRPV
ncbi:MAG TPA: hypothetical protein VFQ61_22110 [Polyangiaceae bacterium]|nr:hypothetical protein [Polyangiaceae bacterium]